MKNTTAANAALTFVEALEKQMDLFYASFFQFQKTWKLFNVGGGRSMMFLICNKLLSRSSDTHAAAGLLVLHD